MLWRASGSPPPSSWAGRMHLLHLEWAEQPPSTPRPALATTIALMADSILSVRWSVSPAGSGTPLGILSHWFLHSPNEHGVWCRRQALILILGDDVSGCQLTKEWSKMLMGGQLESGGRSKGSEDQRAFFCFLAVFVTLGKSSISHFIAHEVIILFSRI